MRPCLRFSPLQVRTDIDDHGEGLPASLRDVLTNEYMAGQVRGGVAGPACSS